MVTITVSDAIGVDDRYLRPVPAISPLPASISARIRTISPVHAMVTGDLRPDPVVSCMSHDMGQRHESGWHQITKTTVGGGFAGLADDFNTRVGPPPPRRPSV